MVLLPETLITPATAATQSKLFSGKLSKRMKICHEKSGKKDVRKMSSLLLNSKKPGVQFEDKWHELKPTVNKLLKQQAVTTQEWQNLFW